MSDVLQSGIDNEFDLLADFPGFDVTVTIKMLIRDQSRELHEKSFEIRIWAASDEEPELRRSAFRIQLFEPIK